MQVSDIKNVSNHGITLLATNGTSVYLPPGLSFDHMDISNLKQLGEKISYTTNLTEVNRKRSEKTVLFD